MLTNIEFANPKLFFLLLVLLPMIVWYFFRSKKNHATIQFSTIKSFENAKPSLKVRFRHVLFALRVVTITFLIVALARPQSTNSWKNVTVEGIDIVMAIDISGTMLAIDLKPDRLGAAKEVAANFIAGRPNDRIGLVVFSGQSFTQCPLTSDHSVLINLLKDIKNGIIQDGTAIGLGIANSVNRLKESSAKSKVIILLTDGENNAGEIAPLTAAEIAKTYGIRIYTIGVGTIGKAPYPVQTPFGTQYQDMDVRIDEKGLTEIAKITDGKYFRATSNKKLKEIYKEIDKLERSKINEKNYSKKKEEFLIFAIIALVSFLAESILRYTIFKNIP